MSTKTTRNGTPQSLSVTGWQNRLHTITCPSGQRLRIRIPGMETLLEHGELPESLIEIALLEVTREDGAAGAIAEQLPTLSSEEKLGRLAEFAAFQRELVRAAVREIEAADGIWNQAELSTDDLREIPDADMELIAMIVLRLRNRDARGVTIGVEPIDRWARFHETHGIDPEGCEACSALIDELSSADLGVV